MGRESNAAGRAWEAQIGELIHLHGGLYSHTRPCMQRGGRWISPVSGDVGAPDFLAVVGPVLFLSEAKTDKARLRDEQRVWRDRLQSVRYVLAGEVWRPRDLETEILPRLEQARKLR
jgi:hypothetical protein